MDIDGFSVPYRRIYCFFVNLLGSKWEMRNPPTWTWNPHFANTEKEHHLQKSVEFGVHVLSKCVNPSYTTYTGRGTEVTAQRRGFCGGTDISEDAHWRTCKCKSWFQIFMNAVVTNIVTNTSPPLGYLDFTKRLKSRFVLTWPQHFGWKTLPSGND